MVKTQNNHRNRSARGKAIFAITALTLYFTGCGTSPTGQSPTVTSPAIPSATAELLIPLPTISFLTETPVATTTPFHPTATVAPSQTSTRISTSTLKAGWVDFINGYYGYAISLPPVAVVTKNDKIDHVQAVSPAGMESGEYFDRLNRTYPPGICISVSYQSVSLKIRVQYSLGGFFVDPCGPGIGDFPYTVWTEEEVFVGEVSYPATHTRVYESDAPDAKSLEEFYYVPMDDGGLVYFGGEWKDQAAYDQYLSDKAVLLEILRSYRSVPKTELFCPEPVPTRLRSGGFAYVSTELPLSYLQQSFKNIKNAPGINQEPIGSIDTGKVVELLEGPVCNNSLQWWKVRVSATGLVGWTPEGDHLTPEGYHESSWLIACESKENCGKP